MLGQEVPCGTGSIEILFDEEKFTDLVGSMSSRPDKLDTVDIEKISEKEQFLDKLCTSNIFSDDMFEKL